MLLENSKNPAHQSSQRYLSPLNTRDIDSLPKQPLQPWTPKQESNDIKDYDHLAFLTREKKRWSHYLSPDCGGFRPERSEYLGDVIASSPIGSKKFSNNVRTAGFASPVRSFMFNTSYGGAFNNQVMPSST
jgi:hypothetical protein